MKVKCPACLEEYETKPDESGSSELCLRCSAKLKMVEDAKIEYENRIFKKGISLGLFFGFLLGAILVWLIKR